jgi:hypothetical protein
VSALRDLGHDLPDAEPWCDAFMIIAKLAAKGFAIGGAVNRQVNCNSTRLFGAGTYRMQCCSRS